MCLVYEIYLLAFPRKWIGSLTRHIYTLQLEGRVYANSAHAAGLEDFLSYLHTVVEMVNYIQSLSDPCGPLTLK